MSRKFADFITGFGAGRQMVKDYRDEQTRRSLAEIGQAKEQTVNGYGAEDEAQREAAANAKDENGNPYYKVGTDAGGKYTITPVNAPTDAPTDAPGETPSDGPGPAMPARFASTEPIVMPTRDRTQFLGKTYDQPLTDPQRDSARLTAMSGVYDAAGDPARAIALRQQGASAEQAIKQGTLTDLNISAAQRADTQGKINEQQGIKLRQVQQEAGDFMAQRLVGPDGNQRQATTEDHLAAMQFSASKLMAQGLTDQAGAAFKEFSAMSFAKIQLETAERDKSIGIAASQLAAGNTQPLVDFYNKFIPDGAHVNAVTPNKDGSFTIERTGMDGSPMPSKTVANVGALTAGLTAFKDPNALYAWSQAEAKRNLDERHMKVAERQADATASHAATAARVGAAQIKHLGAQTDEVKQKTEDRKDLSGLHAELGMAVDAKDKAAEDAARAKLMSFTLSGRGSSNLSTEEKKANFFLASGAAKTMADAARMAHEKVQSSPSDDYIKLSTRAMPMSESELESSMSILHGTNWRKKMGGDEPAAAMPTTESQAHEQARSALAAGAPREAINKRLKDAGFKPLLDSREVRGVVQ